MAIEVILPGPLSSFQDLGRFSSQHLGVFVGGAMDEVSHRLANALVGNPPGLATLEATLLGPTLQFDRPAVVAICGADLSPMLDGAAIANDRAVAVPAGARLSFGQRRSGARAYIAVAGGYTLDKVLDSYSTSLKAGFGGFKGRALLAGDRIGLNCDDGALPEPARIEIPASLRAPPTGAIRFNAGRHWNDFGEATRRQFMTQTFKVQPQSSRMGYRLSGEPLRMTKPRELISEPVRFGTVQVPGDGQPIVLMADKQTVGGYPRIAEVISVDLPRLAQLMPGEAVRFELVSITEAQARLCEREKLLSSLEVPASGV